MYGRQRVRIRYYLQCILIIYYGRRSVGFRTVFCGCVADFGRDSTDFTMRNDGKSHIEVSEYLYNSNNTETGEGDITVTS